MIYIPPNSQKLSDMEVPKIMLGLQGASGTGKTYSGLTYTDITVADFDNNLAAHKHRTDVVRMNFFDDTWLRKNFPSCCKDSKQKDIKYPARDSFKLWLQENGPKFEPGQVLFLDSWSALQDAFDLQTGLEPVFTATGKVDDFAFWALKVDYAQEILSLLRSCKCHVIISFHEQDQRDASGTLIGKVEPLMQGKFVKKLGMYFTDWFRCTVESVVDPADRKKIIGNTFKWQTKSTGEVNLKSRLDLPMFIEPSFKNLVELYFNQKQTTNKI